MVKSMTGFGRKEIQNDSYKVTVELKAVNHRYLDLSIKMPKKFNCFENKIRNYIKQYIERGKVDLYIYFEDYSKSNSEVKYNKEIADKLKIKVPEGYEEIGE